MENTSWALLLKELGTFHARALTISKRVVICPTVVDAQIVQATPEAAHVYGFAQPDALIGQWQSHLQHPEDLQCARQMAALRHYGYTEIPTDYALRIRQGQRDHFQTVRKHTVQVEWEGTTYWLTALAPTRGTPVTLVFDRARFSLPPDALQQYCGVMSVAEMEAVLARVTAPPQAGSNAPLAHPAATLQHQSAQTVDRSAQLAARLAQLQAEPQRRCWVRVAHAVCPLPPQTLATHLEAAQQQHKLLCARCLYVWEPVIPDPRLCPHCQQDWSQPYTRRPYGGRHPPT
jgi:hypothetical protein